MASNTVMVCGNCGSDQLKKEVWESPYSMRSRDMDRAMKKWGLNCIRNYTCTSCGATWRD